MTSTLSSPQSVIDQPVTNDPTAGSRYPTFADRLTGRRNAFGLLRLVFASAVIFSHGFYIGHWPVEPTYHWSNEQSDIGNLAVLGFFVISGYLITRSAGSMGFIPYLWRRALRILPAFLTVLVITAFVIAPWFYRRAHGDLSTYWSAGPDGPGPVTYVLRNAGLEIKQYGIHDVFTRSTWVNEAGEHASVINGSLWTLYFEWLCYLVVGGLALVGLLKRAPWLLPLGAAVAMASTMWVGRVPLMDTALLKTFGSIEGLRLASMFFIGATVALYARRIPYDGRLAALGLTVAVVTFLTGGFSIAGYIGMGYAILWLAAALPERTHSVGTRTDISYGIYVYAWPVQMGLSVYGVSHWGYIPFVALTFLIVVPLAWLSWTLIENPALAFKNKGLGRWNWEVVTRNLRALRRSKSVDPAVDGIPPRPAAPVEEIPAADISTPPPTRPVSDTPSITTPDTSQPVAAQTLKTEADGIKRSPIRPSHVGRLSRYPTRRRRPRSLAATR